MKKSKPRIALISTGGTIEKTYDAFSGVLENRVSVLDVLLSGLRLDCDIQRISLINKDSLTFTEGDIDLIVAAARHAAQENDGVVIVHGTDRLADTGERLYREVSTPRVPLVLTGAMHPYELRNTDATQNMTEALLATKLLNPGVYVAMHNRVLAFPGVYKDRERGTFAKDTP